MLLTLLALSVFDFTGGTPTDLAAALSKKCDAPVVATMMSEQVPKIYLEYQEKADLFKAVGSRLALKSTSQETPVFQPAAMPFFFGLPPYELFLLLDPYHAAFPDKTTDIIKIDKKQEGDNEKSLITCTPNKGEYIALSTLGKCKFSKPLGVHWFVGRYRATAYAKDVDETDFLSLLAKASMGKLVIKEKSMRIELDPTQFRQLYIVWAQAKIDHPQEGYYSEPAVLMRWKLAIETMKVLTEDEIAKMMAAEDSDVEIEAGRTLRLQAVVNEYFKVQTQFMLKITRQQHQDGTDNVYEQAIRDIDFTQPAKVELRATGQCGVNYWVKSVERARVQI